MFTHQDNQGAGGIALSGTVPRDVTLIPDGLPYVITSTLTIPVHTTLTIEPGTIVKMKENFFVYIYGTLTAGNETGTAPAIFTSIKDDTVGGDTNSDGNTTTPAPGDWLSLYFLDGAQGTFNNTILRYGGKQNGPTFLNGLTGHVMNQGGTVTITKSHLSDSATTNLRQSGGTTTITDSTITNAPYGIWVGNGYFTIHNSSIINNSDYGIRNYFSPVTVDAENNWWGSGTGPYHPILNATGLGDTVSDGVDFAPWLTSDPTQGPPPCTENCNSNVLFLPGIMGSRLFEDSSACGIFTNEKERWVSRDDDCDHTRLALDGEGKSLYSLYTKEGDDGVIDDAYSFNMYQSFMNDLDVWKNDEHLIADYALVSYDWRLTLEDILQNGATSTDGTLSYGTSQGFFSAYIYQKLSELARSSRTGKVTIVAHSNGGLVTKALIKKLEDANDPLYDKIDNVIFVAVPQVGTPEAVSNLLHGDQVGPLGFVMYAERLRDLTHNMPGAYHLLPSETYFASVDAPLVTFEDGTATQPFINTYGRTISTSGVLRDFLLGTDGRTVPAYGDLENPTKLRSNLLAYAEGVHQELDDTWEFSSSTTLYQIAGWGEGTLASINYRSVRDCIRVDEVVIQGRPNYYCGLWGSKLTFDPNEMIDGDGTVVVPSALAVSTSSDRVRRYWVNLGDHNSLLRGNRDRVHKDILEIPELRSFINNILARSTDVPLRYVSTSTPFSTSEDRLTFTLHSPLTLEFTDNLGRHVGNSTTTPDEVESTVPGARYKRYGEVQLLSIPKTATGILTLRGVATGSFTLDIKEQSGNVTTVGTSFEGIPSATNTVVTMAIDPAFSPAVSGILAVDVDGDGTSDETLRAESGGTVLPDTTPPEARITFSTSTNSVVVFGIDESGTTTISSTTTYPTFRKNKKQHNGVATTTVTIQDKAGNTTMLIYTEELPSPAKRDFISIVSVSYNGVVAQLETTSVKYKWNTNKKGEHTTFASFLRTASTITESHYRAKKNVTILMTRPTDLDSNDDDGDDVDMRPIKTKITGMVIPSIVTSRGEVDVNY